jgi:hypothetical protein
MAPHREGQKEPSIANKMTYSSTPGTTIDVYDADAQVLEANGWIPVAPSGPTSARPVGTLGLYQAAPGTLFFDTTINKLIISDGVSWRDPRDGSSV